jgi:glycosyltransferase involved in cell wall biosynthesis
MTSWPEIEDTNNIDSLRVHVYTMAWNEEVMLPHFLNHYQIFDKIVVYDNESDDKSAELLDAHEKVDRRVIATNGKKVQGALTNFKNNAWKESRGVADYVIVCDTDEFLFHPNLIDAIKRMRSQGGTIMFPEGYQMLSAESPPSDDNLLETIQVGSRDTPYDKCVLFDPNAISEINFRTGCHVCDPQGILKYFRVPGLALLHYRYLDERRVFARNLSFTQRMIPQDLAKMFSAHQRRSLSQISQAMKRFAEDSLNVIQAMKRAADKAEHSINVESLTEILAESELSIVRKHYDHAWELLRQVSDWHPEWAGVGVLQTIQAHLQYESDLTTQICLRRTAAILATDISIIQAYEILAVRFEKLGFYQIATLSLVFALESDPRSNSLRKKIQQLKMKGSTN